MVIFGNFKFKNIEEAKEKLNNFLESNPDLEKKGKEIVKNSNQKLKNGHDIIKLHYTTLEDLIFEFFKDKKLNITVEERDLYREICKAYIKYDSIMN